MGTLQNLGWRGRAVALAALGAASVSRRSFTPTDPEDPEALEMQVMVAIGLQDSLIAEPPHRSGTRWLGHALAVDHDLVRDVVEELVQLDLVALRAGVGEEIAHELGDDFDESSAAGEVPVVLTDRGLAVVQRWLRRVSQQLRGWPPEVRDVDDADAGG